VILAQRHRWMGLGVIFLAQLMVGILVAPLAFLVPVVIEERELPGWGMVGAYGRYLLHVVSLEWLDGRDGEWLIAAIIACWAVTAVAFVSPIVGPAERSSNERSLRASVVAASLIGASIAALMFAALVEGAIAVLSKDQAAFLGMYKFAAAWVWLGALGVWLASGCVWMYMLRRVGRSRDPGLLDRVLRMVFAGTAIELLLGLPIFLLARRKYDCYCAMATFLNLVMGIAALCWLCGPWALLLVTREARRTWRRGACPACGYPQRSGSQRCSECGAELR